MNERFHPRWLIVSMMVLTAALQFVVATRSDATVAAGRLMDPDCYMRLLRVLELASHGDWFDAAFARTNAPYGETIHWTRPMDALLLAGAGIGGLFSSFDRALWIWGILISPALQLAAIPLLSWALRPYLPAPAFFVAGAMLLLQPTLGLSFGAGRPDHHSLILLCFMAGFGAMLRLIAAAAPNERRNLALWAGIANGIGLWVSVEILVSILLNLAIFGLFWLRRGEDWLGLLARYSWALAATAGAAVLVEIRPSEWFEAHFARISYAHAVLFAMLGASAGILARIERQADAALPPLRRAVFGLAAAALPAIVMAAIWPDFFKGPFAEHVPAEVESIWLERIAELQPILPTSWADAAGFAFQLGPMFVVLPTAVYLLMRGEENLRPAMAAILIGLALFLPLAMLHGRWSSYAQFLFILPWTWLLILLHRNRPSLFLGGVKIPLFVPLFIFIVTGPFLAASAFWAIKGNEPVSSAEDPCRWRDMAAVLSALPEARTPPGAKPSILFTYIHPGPEIAYRTPFAVVGAPYSNLRAILDTWQSFANPDDSVAAEIAAKRGIALILLCRGNAEAENFDRLGENFHRQLMGGNPPAWLESVALPPPLADVFRLYRVNKAELASKNQ